MNTFAAKRKHASPVRQKAKPNMLIPQATAVQRQQTQIRRILQSTGAQAKLTIGQPNSKYEKEADYAADQVMRMSDADVAQRDEADRIQPMQIQRMCPECEEEQSLQRQPIEEEEEELQAKFADEHMQRQPIEEEEEELQAKEQPGQTPQVGSGVESRINSLKGGGQPLDPAARSFFEPRFGHDFSGVRIHAGGNASEAAKSVNARAFTLGNNVVFGSGEYQPQSKEGKRLLGHELVHTIQQTKGKSAKAIREHSHCGVPASTVQRQQVRAQWSGTAVTMKKGTFGLIKGIFGITDAAHLKRTSKGILQIDTNYSTPIDAFRWGLLKEIIASNEKVTIQVSTTINVTFHTVDKRTGKIKSINIPDIMRNGGQTFASKKLQKRIYGTLKGITSQHNDRSMIYISPIAKDSNTMSHELLGHFYLAIKGIPFGHSDNLTTTHNIRQPGGRIFTGKVIDYIKLVEVP